jgi:hypothetical protein
MPDNHTNLPILDDIIKPGKTDRAVHQPSSRVQRSLRSDDETNNASATVTDAKTSAAPAGNDRPDTVELYTEHQPAIDAIDQTEAPPATATDDGVLTDEPPQHQALEGAEQARASVIDAPDLDALTEEILANTMPEIEQLLRDRIRQTLSRHFFAEAGSD